MLEKLDECKHCTLRGNLKACKEVKCPAQNSWYAKEQQKHIYSLIMIAKRIIVIAPEAQIGKDAQQLINKIEGD